VNKEQIELLERAAQKAKKKISSATEALGRELLLLKVYPGHRIFEFSLRKLIKEKIDSKFEPVTSRLLEEEKRKHELEQLREQNAALRKRKVALEKQSSGPVPRILKRIVRGKKSLPPLQTILQVQPLVSYA